MIPSDRQIRSDPLTRQKRKEKKRKEKKRKEKKRKEKKRKEKKRKEKKRKEKCLLRRFANTPHTHRDTHTTHTESEKEREIGRKRSNPR